MAATAAKVCRLCNLDCADKPRSKDELGRYTCKACMDRSVAATERGAVSAAAGRSAAPGGKGAPAASARASGVDDDGLDLRGAAMIELKAQGVDLPEAQSCVKCHGFMQEGQVLCLRCGYDRKRGAKRMTQVERDRERAAERRGSGLLVDPTWVVLALGLPAIGTGVWALADVQMSLVFTLSYGLFSLITSISVLVAQVRDRAFGYIFLMGLYIASFILPVIAAANGSMSGLMGSLMIIGLIGIVAGLCQLYWVFVESGRTYLQLAWCMCIVMRLMDMALGWMAVVPES